MYKLTKRQVGLVSGGLSYGVNTLIPTPLLYRSGVLALPAKLVLPFFLPPILLVQLRPGNRNAGHPGRSQFPLGRMF